MIKAIFLVLFNLIVALLLPPLIDGVMRRVKAVVHSRQGPPLMQTYYDIFKLLYKQNTAVTSDRVFRWTPLICLGSVLLAGLFIPMGADAPLSFGGDVIVLLYLLSVPGITIMLGGMATGSPYAMLGASREMTLVLTVEPILAIALFTMSFKTGSLLMTDITKWTTNGGLSISVVIAAVVFFLAMQSEMAKVPFDIAEAETEIMEGPFVEHSGPKLAPYKWALYSKIVIYASLFSAEFLPGPKTGFLLADLALHLVKILLVIVVVEIIALVNPRLRLDQAVNYFKWVAALAIFGMAFALLGL